MGDGHQGVGAGGLHRGHVTDLLATQGNLSGDGCDAGRCLFGDPLDGLRNLAVGGFLGLFVLDVEVLGVLPDNDHVDGVTAVLTAGGLNRTHVGIKVHLLAESDNRRGVAGDLGAWGAIHGRNQESEPSIIQHTASVTNSPDSSEQSSIAFLLQSLQGLVGQGRTRPVESIKPSIQVDKAEVEVQRRGKRFQNPSTGLQSMYQND